MIAAVIGQVLSATEITSTVREDCLEKTNIRSQF